MATFESVLAKLEAALAEANAVVTEPPPQPTGALSVSLDFGGGSVAVFNETGAVDKGDFVGEFVRLKCYLATNASFPDWRVWFRFDADANGNRIAAPASGWRDEVIVEYGRSKTGAFVNRTTPYTATITKGGATVYNYVVPRHYWLARWRWSHNIAGDNQPRAVVRSVATLKARKWIGNHTLNATSNLTRYAQIVNWPGPMGNPLDPNGGMGNDLAMGGGGDHENIGALTEYAAQYVVFGNANLYTSMMTEGEWTSTWPMFYRNDDASAFSVMGQKFTEDGGTVRNALNISPYPSTEVGMEGAHMYCCANLPWLLTDDPFFLESLQCVVNWQGLYGQAGTGASRRNQTRNFAWGLRDAFLACATTPASTPSWLNNKAYFQTILNAHKSVALRFIPSPATDPVLGVAGGVATSRLATVFRVWTYTGLVGTWQHAMMNVVLGQAIQMGFSDWLGIYKWSVDFHIKMTEATNAPTNPADAKTRPGWPRQWALPYYMFLTKRAPEPLYEEFFPLTGATKTAALASVFNNWTEAWNFFAAGGGAANGGMGPVTGNTGNTSDVSGFVGTDYVENSKVVGASRPQTGWDTTTYYQKYSWGNDVAKYPTNFTGLRSALALAVSNGIPGAQPCFDWINGAREQIFTQLGYTSSKARLAIDPVV